MFSYIFPPKNLFFQISRLVDFFMSNSYMSTTRGIIRYASSGKVPRGIAKRAAEINT